VAAYPHARCARLTLPHELPDGIFDLIVCSDFLVYLREEDIRETARFMRGRTAEGGAIVVVNHRRGITTGSERVLELVAQELSPFRAVRTEELERHRVVRYERLH
jgi:chemotaxis methyl-accepting protein methylase